MWDKLCFLGTLKDPDSLNPIALSCPRFVASIVRTASSLVYRKEKEDTQTWIWRRRPGLCFTIGFFHARLVWLGLIALATTKGLENTHPSWVALCSYVKPQGLFFYTEEENANEGPLKAFAMLIILPYFLKVLIYQLGDLGITFSPCLFFFQVFIFFLSFLVDLYFT